MYELITTPYADGEFHLVEVRDQLGVSIIGIDEPAPSEVEFLRRAVDALNEKEAIRQSLLRSCQIALRIPHEDEPDTDDRDRFEYEVGR